MCVLGKDRYDLITREFFILISKKNIRATSYSEFWGTKFEDSVFLWQGAKNQIPYSQWDSIDTPTLEDKFSTKEDIRLAHDYCKEVYEKIFPKLAASLNRIHKTDHPVSFWRIVCGRWFFEYVCVVYEKYCYLSELDLDNTDLVLLDENSFYTPKDFVDSCQCFTSDFGVQQLVSHYYYLFAKKNFPSLPKEFGSIAKTTANFTFDNIARFIKGHLRNTTKSILPSKKHDAILVKTYINRRLIREISRRSKGKIKYIGLPKVISFSDRIDYKGREKLLDIQTENGSFEYFLVQTLYYALPQFIIEHFNNHYRIFMTDIKAKDFDYIVSEAWLGDFATAIYVAISKKLGKKLIFTQHGAFTQIYHTNVEWLQFSMADKYLTTGWESNHSNSIIAGFACREITDYQYHPSKKNILYVCNAWVLYLVRFMNLAVGNTNSVEKLKMTLNFIDNLPDHLHKNFVLRDRPLPFHWNAEDFLQTEKKGIRMDDASQNLLTSISEARIVVIDHFSTSFAEILAMGTPFIVIHDRETDPLLNEYMDIFAKLHDAGVVHYSAESAVAKLNNIYDNVQQWWNSEIVKKAVDNLKEKTIGPPSQTVEYLLSLVDSNSN